jgi:hypothetical protein
MIAHVGQRVLAQRIGKANELALIRLWRNGSMVTARVVIVLTPSER